MNILDFIPNIEKVYPASVAEGFESYFFDETDYDIVSWNDLFALYLANKKATFPKDFHDIIRDYMPE